MTRLNLGSGRHGWVGWVNLDMVAYPKVDLVCELGVDPIPAPDGTYALVMGLNILEHIIWTKTEDVLAECYRVLRPSGLLQLWVPDFGKIIKIYRDKRTSRKRDVRLRQDYMAYLNDEVFCHGEPPLHHKALFDYPYLARLTDRAGFCDQREMEPIELQPLMGSWKQYNRRVCGIECRKLNKGA